jgi:hypothetical protein
MGFVLASATVCVALKDTTSGKGTIKSGASPASPEFESFSGATIMSNTAHAATAAGPAPGAAHPGRWRGIYARWAAFRAAWMPRRATRANVAALQALSDAELADLGAPPDVAAQLAALREFEYSRAKALNNYYW